MNVASRRTISTPTAEVQRYAPQPGEGIAYLRSVFGGSPQGICIVDASSRVAVWNRAAAAITGYKASEMEGRVCALERTTLKRESFGQAKPSKRQASGAPASACDLCIEKKSRNGRRLNISTSVIPLGHKDAALLTLIAQNSRSPSDLVDGLGPSAGRCQGLPRATCLLALTPREHEILELLAAGQTAKPIATVLSLTLPTVRTHIQNLLGKLGVHSCLEAVTCYLRMRKGRP